MKIGIDIDDTITNTWETVIPYYSKLYGISPSKLKISNPYYQAIKDKVTLEQYYQTIKLILQKIILDVELKPDASRVIKRLHDMGNEIIFITSRSTMDIIKPYETTEKYLKKHHIYYDKLIINQERKDITCLNEKIDIFIDDSNKHCDQVANTGIKVLMFETPYNNYNNKHLHVKSWQEIEHYLLGGKWMGNNRVLTNEILEEDKVDNIRPQTLDEYIGQSEVKENIKVFIKSALIRGESLDHVLLYGPPGLGKTTLAYIIANELGVNIKTASGPSIEKSGDLAAILSTLEPNDVLFIDEIHRIPRFIEEILYPAMEDNYLDIVIGGEGTSRNIKIELPPFTLIGATTRAGDLSSPLRDRFGIISKLNYYTEEELYLIIKRTSRVLATGITDEAAYELARRSRGTPRIANRLFKRVRDFALVNGDGVITNEILKDALARLKVDKLGLDETDYNLLLSIIEKFNGGPVGIEALASSIGEEVSTIEDVYEPYLLQNGYLKRTSRGRMVTDKTYEHLGLIKDK